VIAAGLRLTLRTLTRGDGLLGMRPHGPFGPRGAPVTVAWVEAADEHRLAAAHDQLRRSGLRPLSPDALQWRQPDGAAAAGLSGTAWWSLPLEQEFGDWTADTLPGLQAAGFQVLLLPGYAHDSVPIQSWRLVLDAGTGAELGRTPTVPLSSREAPVEALRGPHGQGSWLLSLGVEIDGQVQDLSPMLAHLIARERRWLDARAIARIDDHEIVKLRAPGGRRVLAPAGPLKAIVASMLDLLTDPGRHEGPYRFQGWEAGRLEELRLSLLAGDMARRAGPSGAWALQGEAGLAALAQRLRAAGPVVAQAPPEGLAIRLRPYQCQGLAWLQALRAQGLGGILADDMGLGKTAQALAHVLAEHRAGRLAGAPALVVVPASLVANWQAEAARMTPELSVHVHQGPHRALPLADLARHQLVITSYPLLWRDLRLLEAQAWHLLILDEAQMVKNGGSRTARAVRRIRARHRLCLTGTPLENHLGELWAQFDFLMPGFLGDRRSFQRQWRTPIERNGETARAELLARRVKPFILRRRKSGVELDLPPMTEVTEQLVLQGGQRALYESVRLAADEQVRRLLERKGFEGEQIAILDALLKLRQVCCDPRLVKGPRSVLPAENAKLDWLREHLPLLAAEGRRALLFSQFTEWLRLLAPELDAWGLPWLQLTGQTPTGERGALVERFQSGEVPFLLASLKAGGVGLNLTAADTVILLDPWWNPAVEQQAAARAHRIGQSRPVIVHRLVAAGSIEQRLLALQARKQALADGVLGSDAALAAKFDAADLAGLLAPLG